MDSHFQRKKKETFIAELMIEGACPSKGIHGIVTLIFNNVPNTKCWKLSILIFAAYFTTDLIDSAIWDMSDIFADKAPDKLAAGNASIPSHLFICVFPSSKASAFTDVMGNCLPFTGWYLWVFLSVYVWP